MPDLRPRAPRGHARASRHRAQARATSTPKSRAKSSSGSSSGSRGSGRLVTRQLARATDDGYRNPLTPGLKATADAERLAVAVTQAHERLEPPGPYTAIDETPDIEHATWLAFLFALAPELTT